MHCQQFNSSSYSSGRTYSVLFQNIVYLAKLFAVFVTIRLFKTKIV